MSAIEVKISQKLEQPLLARTRLEGTISFEAATPSRAELRKKLAEALGANEESVAVTLIKTDFGQKAAKVTAHVYKSKEALEKYEAIKIKGRHLKSAGKQEEKKQEPEVKEEESKEKAEEKGAGAKEKPAEKAEAEKKAEKKSEKGDKQKQ